MNNSYNRISVKFMDDTDGSESAVDKVGPKRTNADADWSLSNKQPAIHWTSICMLWLMVYTFVTEYLCSLDRLKISASVLQSHQPIVRHISLHVIQYKQKILQMPAEHHRPSLFVSVSV